MPDSLLLSSPLDHVSSDAPARFDGVAVTLRERQDLGLALYKGYANNYEFENFFCDQLGVSPPEGRISISAGPYSIVKMGLSDYLVAGAHEDIKQMLGRAHAASEGVPCVVSDLTHGRLIIDMEGGDVLTILSRSCGLDTRLSAFPIGLGTRTRFAHEMAYVERLAENRFRLVVDRSLGAFFWDWLVDASSLSG